MYRCRSLTNFEYSHISSIKLLKSPGQIKGFMLGFSKSVADAATCTMIYNIVDCWCSPQRRTRSHHGPALNQPLDQSLLIHLRRRKAKARDLQDPEPVFSDLTRYPRTLERGLLSSRQRSGAGEGARTSASVDCGSRI